MIRTTDNHQIHFETVSDRLVVQLHRTLRLPENSVTHALPPSLGFFPLKKIEDYRETVPAAWREHGGVFFPMWQREAMWISFHSASERQGRPWAVKVAAGKVNAVSGALWQEELAPSGGAPGNPRQDYLVVPPQPWLDGFNTGESKIRQFVAMPLGGGYTVEAQVTGKEDVGGLQILAVPPKDGLLVPSPPDAYQGGRFEKLGGGSPYGKFKGGPVLRSMIGSSGNDAEFAYASASPALSVDANASYPYRAAEMGLAQGGEMTQKIYPDPHGLDTWKQSGAQRLFVHIVNSELYHQITGERPPPSPISAETYRHYGYPWTTLWDSEKGDVPASSVLAGVKTVAQVDSGKVKEGKEW